MIGALLVAAPSGERGSVVIVHGWIVRHRLQSFEEVVIRFLEELLLRVVVGQAVVLAAQFGQESLLGVTEGFFGGVFQVNETSDNHPDSTEGYSNGTGLFDDGTGTLRDYLTISYRRNLAADDLILEVEACTDLVAWSALSTVFVSAVHNGDGTETATYRSTTPIASLLREFIRLSVRTR